MRSHPPSLVVLALAFALSSCGDDARAPATAFAPRGPARRPAAALPSSREPGARAAPEAGIHDVAALVVDQRGVPVQGRPVVVVDARGKHLPLMTDEGGSFHAMDVAPPYDVAIEAAPSGPVIVPVAYLGLTRERPRFVLDERDGDRTELPSQTVRVLVSPPPCQASTCRIAVVTASASGGGAGSSTFQSGGGPVATTIEHAFRSDTAPEGEPIEVHVLVQDESRGASAYGRAVLAASPGEVTDVAVAPSVIESADPVAIDAASAAVPAGWEWSVATWLELPAGGTLALKYAAGPALVTRVPLVPGAKMAVGAWAQRPPGADGAQRSAVAWSGPLDLRATRQVRLDLHPGPTLERPSSGGRLSRRGTGIAWSPKSPFALTVSMQHLTTGKHEFLVHTAGAGVSLRRLDRLGMVPPELGGHVLDVTSHAGASVDDLVDETNAGELATFRPGASAHQRVRFDVTP